MPASDPDRGGSGTLGAYYVSSFEPFEALAQWLRTYDRRYLLQKEVVENFQFPDGKVGELVNDPLSSSGIEYAHALGLTGEDQIIAIMDRFFIPDHEAIGSKAIPYNDSTLTEEQNNIFAKGEIGERIAEHGTAVASVAVGDSERMIGVAPGARFLFGKYPNPNLDTLYISIFPEEVEISASISHIRQAINANAIVHLNSWGTDLFAVNEDSFQQELGGSRQEFFTAYADFAAERVVIFSISNDNLRTTATLYEALPALRHVHGHDLEAGWLAVGSGLPQFNDEGRLISVDMLSSGCLEAAPWCLLADGAWITADYTATDAYAFNSGTSFAAPQVAGAIALLAQAFPTLTPHQLRLRLLASAENSFFTPDGMTQLTPDFAHGYHTTYGHGFLNIRAALLPIGIPTMLTEQGRVSVSRPLLMSGSALGDAIKRKLEGLTVFVSDSLEGQFILSSSTLTAVTLRSPLANALKQEFEETAVASPLAEPFRYDFGQSVRISSPLSPSPLSQNALYMLASEDSYGFAFARQTPGVLRLGSTFKIARDDGTILGFQSEREESGAYLVSAQLGIASDWGNGWSGGVSGEWGLATLETFGILSEVSPVTFNNASLRVIKNTLFTDKDQLSLTIDMPTAIASGDATLFLPLSDASSLSRVTVDLAPSVREVDVSLRYRRTLSSGMILSLGMTHAENRGNLPEVRDTTATFTLNYDF